jgi:intracellular multiplication protein IcmD
MSTASTSEITASLDQISPMITQAINDPSYRETLLASPSAALTASDGSSIESAEGGSVDLPDGMSLESLENSDAVRYFVTFDQGEMSAEDQQQLASMLSQVTSIQSDVDAWAKIVLDSWSDSSLRAKLESDPGAVLAQYGYTLPSGASAKIAHASTSTSYMVVPPSTASASSTTIGEMASTITSSMEAIAKLVTAGSYLAGLGFALGSIMKFKQHKDNPTQIPIGTPIALIFIGAALLFLPSILGVAGQTMFGDGGGTTAGPTGTVFTG